MKQLTSPAWKLKTNNHVYSPLNSSKNSQLTSVATVYNRLSREQEEALRQQEAARRQKLDQGLVAAGLAQAARAAEALNSRLCREYSGFGRYEEPGRGIVALGRDVGVRQQQNKDQRLANAGLAQAARAADALRRRVLREYKFDVQYEGRDQRATPFRGVKSDNGKDDDHRETWSPGYPSYSSGFSMNLVTLDTSTLIDDIPDKIDDEANLNYSCQTNYRSESASFDDHTSEEHSSEEPRSSDDEQSTEVGGVKLEPRIVHNESSPFEDPSACSSGLDHQGELDEEGELEDEEDGGYDFLLDMNLLEVSDELLYHSSRKLDDGARAKLQGG